MSPRMPGLEAWLVTGSQHLYGRGGPRARRRARAGHRRVPRRGARDPGHGGRQAGRHDTRRHRRRPARGRQLARLRRRHRLDAHVLAGQDVDRRPDRPAQAAGPPAHPVQPRSPVGGDRHGLHEPPPVRPRRPGVRVHPDAAAARPQDGRRPLAGPAGLGAPRLVDAGRGRLARVAPAPDRAVRRQHARGRGHRRRQGRGPGPARLLGQRLRRRRPGRARRGGPRGRGRHAWSTRTPTDYELAPALRPGGDRHAELRTAARIEGGPAVVPASTAGSAPSPTRSRTWARSRSCPGSASSG